VCVFAGLSTYHPLRIPAIAALSFAFTVCVTVAEGGAQQRPRLVGPASAISFGVVVRGATVTADLPITNEGSAPLHINRVELTPPLRVTAMKAELAPGERGAIKIAFDTSQLLGPLTGEAHVLTDDPDTPELVVEVTGRVVRIVDAEPQPAIFLTAQRDHAAETSIDIVNYGEPPITLTGLEYGDDRYTITVATIDDGRRYRLTLRTKAGAAGGRRTEIIRVHTSSAELPVLPLLANTYLRERVYAFPESVEMGALPLPELTATPDAARGFSQTLMVYRPMTNDFTVSVPIVPPWLEVDTKRGPLGDRWQITLSLKPTALICAIDGTGGLAGSTALMPAPLQCGVSVRPAA